MIPSYLKAAGGSWHSNQSHSISWYMESWACSWYKQQITSNNNKEFATWSMLGALFVPCSLAHHVMLKPRSSEGMSLVQDQSLGVPWTNGSQAEHHFPRQQPRSGKFINLGLGLTWDMEVVCWSLKCEFSGHIHIDVLDSPQKMQDDQVFWGFLMIFAVRCHVWHQMQPTCVRTNSRTLVWTTSSEPYCGW